MATGMKYCRKCGFQISEDARFCTNCGAEAAAPADAGAGDEKATKFCRNCGKVISRDANFCRYCGYQPGAGKAENAQMKPDGGRAGAKQGGGKAVAKQGGGRAGAKTDRQEKSPKRSATGRSGGNRVLAVILVAAVFMVTAFKYPGFLVSGNKPQGKPAASASSSSPSSASSSPDAVPTGGPGDAVAAAESEEEERMLLPASELRLRYTPDQLENAPVRTAEVAPGQGSAVLGSVRVDIPSWEIPEEGDRIEVRELPELSQGENGWSIRAYDFSLASGVREFDSDLTLTIPREGTGRGLSGCVWYDEENGRWEDVYSEVSGDGKYYTLYTDHFSLFGEKKYKFDSRLLDLVEDDGTHISLRDGIFIECDSFDKDRMNHKVMIDYDLMWNLFQNKNLDNVKDVGNSVELLTKDPKYIASLSGGDLSSLVDTVGDYFGYAGVGDGAFGTAAGLMGRDSPLPDAVGQCLTMADVMLTGYKVYAEAKSDTTNTYGKALANTLMNHKLDLAGTAAGVAGVFAPAALNPVFAVVGLTFYAASQAYQTYYENGIEEWYTKYYPDEGEVFRRFYEDAGVRLYFDSAEIRKTASRDYHTAVMDRPPSMDDKEYREFRKFVNEELKGLRTDSYKGFAAAFSKLIELYADDTEYLETILDEFYRSVAGAFWKLPEGTLTMPGAMVYFLQDHCGLGSDPYLLPRVEQIRLSDSYVMKLKIDTTEILENVAKRFQRKSCEELIRRLENEFLPVLNRQLVFHVADGALAPGQTFADSVYCVDWQTINSNWRYRSLPDGEGSVFDDGFRTPMRFDRATEPKFLPLDYGGNVISERNYYPYTPNFIPRANKKNDVVFRCTYYHYLMMGAPKQMVFLDLKSGKETKASIDIPKFNVKDASRPADIYVTVNGKKLDIPEIKGSLFYAEMRDTGASPSNRLTVSPSGEVKFVLSQVDGYRHSFTQERADLDYEIYNEPALTVSGRVKEVTEGVPFSSDISVSKIDGSGGSSKAPELERLTILSGYLTSVSGPFEHRYIRYSNGELYSDQRHTVKRAGIAPAGYPGSGNLDQDGYSTFVIWQSKETGAIGASIRFRGDILYARDGGPAEKDDFFEISLEEKKPCPRPLLIGY